MTQTLQDERVPSPGPPLLCSECFVDNGLRLDARRLGTRATSPCPNCGAVNGAQLNADLIQALAHRFFVQGSLHKTDYGGAPLIEFNGLRKNEVHLPAPLQKDADLISAMVGIGFFPYGPPLWRIGYVEPLEALQDESTRTPIIDRILAEYPKSELAPDHAFYRLRKGVQRPNEPSEYDSPPAAISGNGRLDSSDLPVLYGSPDLEVCIHECRVTAEDLLHVATLNASCPLQLLDLTAVLQEDVTSFESLDMAVHMLFLAGAHSYPINRAVAAAAHSTGFDGVLFPSYFSLLRTGAPYIETAYGLSTRVFPGAAEREAGKTVPNIAIFGRPIADGRVTVSCINRVYLRQVAYDLGFGPANP
jgi:hypothetical protein